VQKKDRLIKCFVTYYIYGNTDFVLVSATRPWMQAQTRMRAPLRMMEVRE
jgi:hypothetical protein